MPTDKAQRIRRASRVLAEYPDPQVALTDLMLDLLLLSEETHQSVDEALWLARFHKQQGIS